MKGFDPKWIRQYVERGSVVIRVNDDTKVIISNTISPSLFNLI
jgi:hypothetical protein